MEQLHKKNLITKDLVLIAWIEEELDDCFDQFDNILKNEVQIVVHPLSSGLFQIRVREVVSSENWSDYQRDPKNIGSVLDNFVIRKESLSAFVRTIAMFSHQVLRSPTDSDLPLEGWSI